MKYERPRNRRIERAIAARLALRHGFLFTQNAEFSEIDLHCRYEVGSDFLMEVKRRECSFGTYKDVTVDDSKWQAALALVRAGRICHFAFKFNDGVRRLTVNLGMAPDLRYRWRYDRKVLAPCRGLLNEWWEPWEAPRLPRWVKLKDLMKPDDEKRRST